MPLEESKLEEELRLEELRQIIKDKGYLSNLLN